MMKIGSPEYLIESFKAPTCRDMALVCSYLQQNLPQVVSPEVFGEWLTDPTKADPATFATVMAISHLDIILYTQAKTLVELGKTPLPPKFTKVYLLMCAGLNQTCNYTDGNWKAKSEVTQADFASAINAALEQNK